MRALSVDHGDTSPDSALFGIGCRGKIGHSSKRLASGHMRAMLKRGMHPKDGMHFNVYSCRVCRHWHIGNSR